MEFKDRVANKPNRVKLTYEDSGASSYATVELADEPIEEGTPINKKTFDDLANYQVGDVFITTNPNCNNETLKKRFGGTWTFHTRRLYSRSLSATQTNTQKWFAPSDALSDYTVRIAINGVSITFELDLKTKNAIGTDENVSLGFFDYSELGITGFHVTPRCVAYSDDGNTYAMIALNPETGELKLYDSRPSGLKPSNSFKVTFCVTVAMGKTIESHCNEFHWRRTQ